MKIKMIFYVIFICIFFFSILFILEKYEFVFLMILGFVGFFIVLVIIYNFIRKYIYKDVYSLDMVFDVGGKVIFSLMVVIVML